MKTFDHPYINDSPIDLSGIEGAPRPWTCDDCGTEVRGGDDHRCLAAPDYPATCNECGWEGTNATAPAHDCGPLRIVTTRTFTDILDEWTKTMLQINKETGSLEVLALIARFGLMGQRLITEANVVGMTETARRYK